MSTGMELLLDGARGVYIPINFAQMFKRKEWGLTKTDLIPLKKGPEHDWYWEAWDSVLNKAQYTDEQGHTWTLYQDGDLWAVCPELMTNEEYADFFGEPKPCPEGWMDYVACADCLNYIANGELPDSFAGDDIRSAVARLPGQAVADGADLGFCHDKCEICGALPGNRYRVLVKEEEPEVIHCITEQENAAIASLRDRGYAVIIWTPEELRDAPPGRVEDRCIEQGWDTIEYLQGEEV